MIIIDEKLDIPRVILPEITNRFIKVPKEIILAKEVPEHRLSVFLYFNYNQTWDEMVHYSPLYMIQWSGYKTTWNRSNKDNIYEKFKRCMQWSFENGYIIDFDVSKYILSNFQSSLLNYEKIRPLNNFGLLYDFEIDAINNFKSDYKPLNKSVLLLLLSYVRAFTWIRSNEISGHSMNSQKEKPEILQTTFQSIEFFTGIPRKLASRAMSMLESMGFVITHRMPKYKDTDGGWHSDDLICVCPYKYLLKGKEVCKCTNEEYSSEKELQYGIDFVKSQTYFSKKFYQD